MINTKNEEIDKLLEEKVKENMFCELCELISCDECPFANQIIQEVRKDTRQHDLVELEKKKIICGTGITIESYVNLDDIRKIMEGK